MKKFSFILLLSFIFMSMSLLATITKYDVGGNDQLAACLNAHGYEPYQLSTIDELDCSCEAFYPIFVNGFFGPIYSTANASKREECHQNKTYGPAQSTNDKNFVITSFAGLEALTNLRSWFSFRNCG